MSNVKQRTLYEVSKKLTVHASRQLTNIPHENPRSQLHGHNFRVEVVLVGAMLDTDTMMLVDTLDIDAVILDKYNFKNLNSVMSSSPTTEMFAHDISREVMGYLFKADIADVVRVTKVTVTESEDCSASVHMLYSEDL